MAKIAFAKCPGIFLQWHFPLITSGPTPSLDMHPHTITSCFSTIRTNCASRHLSLTVLLILAPHFFTKALADDLRFSFTNLVRNVLYLSLLSLKVRQNRFNVLTFPVHRNFRGIVAMVPLGRFVSLANAVIKAPPLFIPTINDRSSSVTSFSFSIFVFNSVWLWWQMLW